MSVEVPRKPSAGVAALRWLAFLPAALVGALIASVISHFFFWFFWSISPSRAEIVLQELLEGASFGAAFVFVGVHTAPRFSVPLCVVMGTLGALLSVLLTLDALGRRDWAGGLTAAAGAVASVVTASYAVQNRGFG